MFIERKWSADILSASGQSPLRVYAKYCSGVRFALRAQGDKMSALRRVGTIYKHFAATRLNPKR